MSVTLVLEQITLPPTGMVKLQFDYTFDLKISAEEARRRAHTWLVGEVSYMIRADEPSMVIEETATNEPSARWRVPAILTATHVGDMGTVGYVDIAVDTGELRNPTLSAANILDAAEHLAASLPPYEPAKDMPSGFLVSSLQPTIAAPTGDPVKILQSIH